MALKPTMQLAVCLGMMALLSVAACAQKPQLYVYGDSWSDTGRLYERSLNNAPNSTYWYQGRFTNFDGNWVDRINNMRVADVTSFAWGGASACPFDVTPIDPSGLLRQIPNLQLQVRQFVKPASSAATRVHVLLMGLNDLVLYPTLLPNTVANSGATVDCVIQAAKYLIDNGEENVVIGTIPPAQLFPQIFNVPVADYQTLRTRFATAINAANAALYAKVLALALQKPAAKVALWDVATVTSLLVNHYDDVGFKAVGPCLTSPEKPVFVLDVPGVVDVCLKPDEQLFYDPLHLSSRGYALLAQSLSLTLQITRVLNQPIVPFF